MAAKKKKLTEKVVYEKLHRWWTGLSIICFLVAIVASYIHGASIITVAVRALVVLWVLYLIGRIIIRSWASWEELKRGQG